MTYQEEEVRVLETRIITKPERDPLDFHLLWSDEFCCFWRISAVRFCSHSPFTLEEVKMLLIDGNSNQIVGPKILTKLPKI